MTRLQQDNIKLASTVRDLSSEMQAKEGRGGNALQEAKRRESDLEARLEAKRREMEELKAQSQQARSSSSCARV